ncbi:MAG: BlaI/MecI/CopY family transcriptional regulator [Planctomycetota bacterium]
MSKRKPLSKSEIEVLRVVWQLKSATVREVHEEVSANRKVDFNTVQTFLSRLADKGYLKYRLEGRTRVYSAKAKRENVILHTVDDFVGSLFGGEPMPLIRHLLSESTVTPEQVAELRKLLKAAEESGNE